MQLTDKEILDAIHHDKHQGFTLLVQAYTQPAYWHIRRLVEDFDDTQDVVQETFMRVFKALDSFRAECSLRTWIYRIATNEALRFLEHRQRDNTATMVALDQGYGVAADEYIDYSDAALLRFQQALDTLPARQRAVFNLRYYDEMGYDQIAEVLEITASAARASYHLAKDKIKSLLLQ